MRLNIDPTVDVVFKSILGSDHHKDLLIDFINNILSLEGDDRVISVTLIDPFTLKDYLSGKASIVDVKATDQKGRTLHIDIQARRRVALMERMLFYWSGMYHGQLQEGDTYDQLKPVISIWLLVDRLPPLPTSIPGMFPTKSHKTALRHIPFGIYSPEAGVFLTQDFGLHVIQLKNMNLDAKISDDKDRWIYFFRNGKNLDPTNLRQDMDTPTMREVVTIANTFNEKEESYSLYQSRLEERRSKISIINGEQDALAALKLERAAREREQAEKERLLAILKRQGIDPNSFTS